MNVLFDTSVWVDHLRGEDLARQFPRIRARCELWMDSVALAELLAGCRSRKERRVVQTLVSPFKMVTPGGGDFRRAGEALSKLRGDGVSLRNPGSALLDALQAADAVRVGALLVTHNIADFSRLAVYLPCRVESFERFQRSL